MARFAVGHRTTGAGTTTLPMSSLYATAGVRPRLREVGVFNTTAVAVAIALRRFTSVGTPGSGLTEGSEDDTSQAQIATTFDTHTGTAPTAGVIMRVADLGAAIGSGVIWTFGGNGLVIPNTTGDGVGVICLSGTSQICDVYWSWDE